MNISLRADEKIYINGAVLRVDRQQRHDDERGQGEKADEYGRHGYFICSSSRTAPAWRRAERSASAFMPPAA